MVARRILLPKSRTTSSDNLFIPIEDLSLESGPRNDIWTGRYDQLKVVLKPIRLVYHDGISSLREQLLQALPTWSSLNHPNILKVYGWCGGGPYAFALVSPWVAGGDVLNYIERYPTMEREHLVLDILCGLIYLHSLTPAIVHGDLRASNVLMDASGHAVLADFGLSRVFLSASLDEIPESSRSHRYARWLPPERLDPDHFHLSSAHAISPAADIWSFGMVIYEIYSGHIPFYETRNHFRIPSIIQAGKRPTRPGEGAGEVEVPNTIWSVMEECWTDDWRKRPTAKNVSARLGGEVPSEKTKTKLTTAFHGWCSERARTSGKSQPLRLRLRHPLGREKKPTYLGPIVTHSLETSADSHTRKSMFGLLWDRVPHFCA